MEQEAQMKQDANGVWYWAYPESPAIPEKPVAKPVTPKPVAKPVKKK